MQKFRVPPIPPRKTPLKPKKTSKSNLSSLVSEYDELCQKSQTFNNGGEGELLAFMKNAKEWRQKMFTAESEAQRVSKLIFDTEKELQSKDQKIKQARQMVNLEMRERQKIEQECEELQRKWESLQSFVKTGAGVVRRHSLKVFIQVGRCPVVQNRTSKASCAPTDIYKRAICSFESPMP